YMAVLDFLKMPRSEQKCLYSDKLLGGNWPPVSNRFFLQKRVKRLFMSRGTHPVPASFFL
ncbi:MAG TPA: hypothetical protein VJ969_00335, partial [Desulfopila sp.]|nr:hypothetical protein [Desulfopila sp.]